MKGPKVEVVSATPGTRTVYRSNGKVYGLRATWILELACGHETVRDSKGQEAPKKAVCEVCDPR